MHWYAATPLLRFPATATGVPPASGTFQAVVSVDQ